MERYTHRMDEAVAKKFEGIMAKDGNDDAHMEAGALSKTRRSRRSSPDGAMGATWGVDEGVGGRGTKHT